MEGCVSKGCVENLKIMFEAMDGRAYYEHACKYHPEIRKTALVDPCVDVKELNKEIEKYRRELAKSCLCKVA